MLFCEDLKKNLPHTNYVIMNVTSYVTTSTPDVTIVDEDSREVTILEVGCTFDYSLEEAFLTKVVKYQQLKDAVLTAWVQV